MSAQAGPSEKKRGSPSPVVLARGVSVITNNTRTIDTVLNATKNLVEGKGRSRDMTKVTEARAGVGPDRWDN